MSRAQSNRIWLSYAGPAGIACFRLQPELLLETEKLGRSWARHEGGWLRDYLIAGVEDPRLNLQSILSRHFLVRQVLAEPPEVLMIEEYRFAATMAWLLSVPDLANEAEARFATLFALRQGSDNAEGIEIPPFVLKSFKNLPLDTAGLQIPNYIEQFLTEKNWQKDKPPSIALDSFGHIWSRMLPGLNRTQTRNARDRQVLPADGADPGDNLLSVLEPACGSANDYRFLHSYGIAPMLKYTGLDLCEKNIENARALFPNIAFCCGNVFEIPANDQTFDVCIIHDLFEHLSPAGLEQAVREACRVTRFHMCVGFFQMAEIAEHVVRPVEEYYWNLLSMGRIRELFSSHGFTAKVINIDTFLHEYTGAPRTHNPNAYTLVLSRA